MKIEKLTLYNFSSFEGTNTFDFTVEGNKNIILIGGKNGAGKTSLFTAIKVGLYGPGAFGYVGMNPRYVQKIKELINSKTFQKEKVEAGVFLTIRLCRDRDIETYQLIRKWDYSNKKLEEEFQVLQDGIRLSKEKQDYFENYFLSIIPPGIFEFFLFDGEEIGSMFAENHYNTYIKKALFTMCNLDVFESVRKFSSRYVAKNKNTSNEEEREYEQILEQIEEKKQKQRELQEAREKWEKELEMLQIEKIALDEGFKKGGGIFKKEKERLLKSQTEAERVKNEMTGRIKAFVEGDMPFYIVREFTDEIQKQILFEEEKDRYDYVVEKLPQNTLKKILEQYEIYDPKIEEEMLNDIYRKFQPSVRKGEIIFGLSKEQKSRVLGVIANIQNFHGKEILKVIERRQEAADITAKVNKALKEAMGEEEEKRFEAQMSGIERRREGIKNTLEDLRVQEGIEEELLERLDKDREKYLAVLLENAQSKNAYELSQKIELIMRRLLEQKVQEIVRGIEKITVENLQKILRKNNLITHIEINEKWQFQLYQNQVYTEEELVTLMKNLGIEEFKKQIGEKGLEKLCEKYQNNNLNYIKKYLIENWNGDEIELYKRIDFNRLSKGERQIFILSIYWAIIRISGQNIPFVIDTPYARIDAKHREEISRKFFPDISEQVIILSTDEEINEEYYKVLKPSIANEYLLINDESENRTTVKNQYFYEGAL